jgi:predicted amidohydrolase YtcJ
VSLGGWWTQTGDALYLRNGIIDHNGGNDDVQAMASSRNAQVLGFASTLGGIKAFADGSLGSRTAYMEKPWPGEPDNHGYHTYESVDWLADRFRKADENGLWIWTHAIGDRANKEVLDAFEQAGVAVSKGHAHHRIEHAQFLRPQDVERFANLGITASMQPSHLDLDIGKLKTVFPTPHPRSYAFKSLLESGAELNFGSDAPVENPDALKGIAFAAFRTQISRSCRGIF